MRKSSTKRMMLWNDYNFPIIGGSCELKLTNQSKAINKDLANDSCCFPNLCNSSPIPHGLKYGRSVFQPMHHLFV
jgi:hypothetical protein